MGAYSGPELVDDGLVLALDAANTRSYGGSGTTWTDVSYRGNNGTLTNGPVFTQEPSLEPFGGAGAVAFDGSGDYLSLASNSDFSFGTGDFTIECFFYLSVTTGDYRSFIGIPHSSGQVGFRFGNSDAYNSLLQAYIIGATAAQVYSINVSQSNLVGGWHHAAFTRSGTTCRIFLDGIQYNVGSGLNPTSFPNSSFTDSTNITNNDSVNIGRAASDLTLFNGYISNLRVVKGTALYTSNFTPKRQPLIPESAPNTVLLTCQKGTIRDRSPSAHTITINGDAKSISGASYFDFDGSNEYVSITSNSDFDFGTDNYTIEAWIYINDSVQQYHGIFGSSGTGSDSLQFQLQDGKIRLSSYTAEILVSDAADVVPFRQWTHVVISRSGTGATDTKLYKNGSLIKSGQDNINWGSYNREIGRVFSDNAYDLYGKISGVKIYKTKGLTAAEVLQNYQNTKSRYGL